MPDNHGAQAAPLVPTAGLGSRALRNTVLILSARVVSRLIALVTVFATATRLRDAGFGDFNTVVTVSALVAPVFLDLGFNILYQREGARQPSEIERYLQNLMSARVILAVIAFPILALALYVLKLSDLLIPGYVLMVLTSYANLLRYTLYALQRLGFEAIAIVLESLLLLGLTLFGVLDHQGVAYFLWAYVAMYAFDCVFFSVLLRRLKIARFRWRFEPELLRQWFWMGLPFAVTFVLTTLYWKLDVPLLKLFRSSAEVGWYSLAYKPFEALLFVPITMLGVVLPVLAVYQRATPDRLRVAVVMFFKALLMLGWPLSVGLAVLAHPLAGLWSGFFKESIPALQILALAFVFAFVNNAFIGALTVLDRQATYAKAAGASLVVNLVLNLILIPPFGYIAAAWTTVATEIVLVCAGWWLTVRHLGQLHLPAASWRPVLAGLLMGAALFPFRNVQGDAVLLVVLLGMAVYAVAVVVLRTMTREEIQFLRAALLRRPS
ncbi:MAG: flippase [Candidatus Dormibacteraeota bacterium]|nr:flippase [Candidatus Dormibacteraeota bacterium]